MTDLAQVRDGKGSLLDSATLPADRTFRDAWVDNGSGGVNLDRDLLVPIATDLINQWRETNDQAPVSALGRSFSADELSRSARNITGAALMATIAQMTGQAYEVDWSDATNDKVPLDIQGVWGLGITLATRTSFLYSKARDLKDAASAAATAGDILDILTLLQPGNITIPFNPGNT